MLDLAGKASDSYYKYVQTIKENSVQKVKHKYTNNQ
jgi:hypothetical protein